MEIDFVSLMFSTSNLFEVFYNELIDSDADINKVIKSSEHTKYD